MLIDGFCSSSGYEWNCWLMMTLFELRSKSPKRTFDPSIWDSPHGLYRSLMNRFRISTPRLRFKKFTVLAFGLTGLLSGSIYPANSVGAYSVCYWIWYVPTVTFQYGSGSFYSFRANTTNVTSVFFQKDFLPSIELHTTGVRQASGLYQFVYSYVDEHSYQTASGWHVATLSFVGSTPCGNYA